MLHWKAPAFEWRNCKHPSTTLAVLQDLDSRFTESATGRASRDKAQCHRIADKTPCCRPPLLCADYLNF